MPIKEITIQPHFVMVGGALVNLGMVWGGSIQDQKIGLNFIGGGKMDIYRDDGNGYIEAPLTESATILYANLFDQLRAYLKVNLKPIEIV